MLAFSARTFTVTSSWMGNRYYLGIYIFGYTKNIGMSNELDMALFEAWTYKSTEKNVTITTVLYQRKTWFINRQFLKISVHSKTINFSFLI